MKANRGVTLIEVMICAAMVAVLLVMFISFIGGTDDDVAVHALHDHGFTDVAVTERGRFFPAYHHCSGSDGTWYYTNATNPVGARVSVTVCCGAGLSNKGCTIRSDR